MRKAYARSPRGLAGIQVRDKHRKEGPEQRPCRSLYARRAEASAIKPMVVVWIEGKGSLGVGTEGIALRDVLGIQPGHESGLGQDCVSQFFI